MLIATKEDLLAFAAKCVLGDDEAAKTKAQAQLENVYDKFFTPLEKLCPAEGYFNGLEFPTAADLAFLVATEAPMPSLKAIELAGGFDYTVKHPKIGALVKPTREASHVVEYLENSPT